MIGPLLGGLLIAAKVGHQPWRPIFLVNVPIGLGAVIAAIRLLPESRSSAGRIDFLGLGLVSASLFSLTFALIEGRTHQWSALIIVLIIASAPMLVAFVLWERRRQATQRDPLIDMRLFANRAFSAGALIALIYFAGFTSLFFTISLYLQQGMALSPLAAGAAATPFALVTFVGSAVSDRVAARLGRYVIHIGSLLVLAGLLGFLAAIQQAGTGLHALLLAPGLAIAGFGSGLIIAPLMDIVLAGVGWQDAGAASGVIMTAQRLGNAIGIALVGVVLFAALGGYANHASQRPAAALTVTLEAQHVRPAAARATSIRFAKCFHEQTSAVDPTAPPAGCPALTGGSPIARSVRQATRGALRADFTHSIQFATLFNLAAVGLTLILGFALPREKRGD